MAGSRAEAWRADGLRCTVLGLLGLPDAAVERSEGTNAYGRYSAVPTVHTAGPAVYGQVYVAAVILTGAANEPLPRVTVRADALGAGILVRWPDGQADQFRLDPAAGG